MDMKELFGDKSLAYADFEKAAGEHKAKFVDLSDGGYVGKEKFDASETTISDLKKQLSDRDKDIKELKKSVGDNADLTKQLTDLQTKYDTDTKALNDKISQNALNAALDLGITKAKGKNSKAIKALLDTSKMVVKEDGTVEGLDAALETLKGSDGYLFTQEETKPQGSGFQTGTPAPNVPEAKVVEDAFAAARGTI